MPRTARAIEAGLIYHVLNRGNGRMCLFHDEENYAGFEQVLAQGLQRYPVDLLTYCLMPRLRPPRHRSTLPVPVTLAGKLCKGLGRLEPGCRKAKAR